MGRISHYNPEQAKRVDDLFRSLGGACLFGVMTTDYDNLSKGDEVIITVDYANPEDLFCVEVGVEVIVDGRKRYRRKRLFCESVCGSELDKAISFIEGYVFINGAE